MCPCVSLGASQIVLNRSGLGSVEGNESSCPCTGLTMLVQKGYTMDMST